MQIRVFDLRMHRMLSPLQVTAPPSSVTGVGYLRLIPQVDTDPLEFGSLLVCTDDGFIQVESTCAALACCDGIHSLCFLFCFSILDVLPIACPGE